MTKSGKSKMRRVVQVVHNVRDECMRRFRGRKEKRACVIGAQLIAGVVLRMKR